MEKTYVSIINNGSRALYIKDAEARLEIIDIKSSITGAMHFVGITTTVLSDGSTINPVVINGINYTTLAGDVVIYNEMEYVFNGTKWQEFGSTGSLKSLAFKDNARGNYTPIGTNASSAVTLIGGSTSKLVTTSIKGVSGSENVHDTPTLNKTIVKTVDEFTAGTLPSMIYNESTETITFNTGTLPGLTTINSSVGTSLSEGTEKTFAIADNNTTTVATGSVNSEGEGAVVATSLHTGGTAAALTFSGTQSTITVS